jgi:hypothetical protein
MGLDELFDGPGERPGRPPRTTSSASGTGGRKVAIGAGAVLAAVALGVGVGVLAAQVGDGDSTAAPSVEPTAAPTTTAPSTARPATTSPAPRSPTPTPTRTSDVPASGTDMGYFRAARTDSPSGEERSAVVLSFDRVQFLTGEEAEREAKKRDEEAPNDYYVVNDNTRLREVRVRRDAVVTGDTSFNSWAGDRNQQGQRRRTLQELVDFVATQQGQETLFDLRYDRDGFVIAVTERYLP